MKEVFKLLCFLPNLSWRRYITLHCTNLSQSQNIITNIGHGNNNFSISSCFFTSCSIFELNRIPIAFFLQIFFTDFWMQEAKWLFWFTGHKFKIRPFFPLPLKRHLHFHSSLRQKRVPPHHLLYLRFIYHFAFTKAIFNVGCVTKTLAFFKQHN